MLSVEDQTTINRMIKDTYLVTGDVRELSVCYDRFHALREIGADEGVAFRIAAVALHEKIVDRRLTLAQEQLDRQTFWFWGLLGVVTTVAIVTSLV